RAEGGAASSGGPDPGPGQEEEHPGAGSAAQAGSLIQAQPGKPLTGEPMHRLARRLYGPLQATDAITPAERLPGRTGRYEGRRRTSGRVRQVGPPPPLTLISDPWYVVTRAPTRSRRLRVTGLPSSITHCRGAIASTLAPMLGNSSSGTSTNPTPRACSHSTNGTGMSAG